MEIIDAHFHYSKIHSFEIASRQNGVDYSPDGWVTEANLNHIVAGICMGLCETKQDSFPDDKAETPMGYDLGIMPSNFYYCAGINPHRLDAKVLNNLEKALHDATCVGIKLYAGYYHYMVSDPIYEPVYRLALKFDLPVVIHSGDTYSQRGLLKYSHPFSIDELAVTYPDLKIMIAHLGNPWLMDTAEILYKNQNVFADLSGLLVGDKALINRFSAQELYLNMFRTALILADSYDKLLFGTDWPLTPVDVYVEFIKRIIPSEHHNDVFFANATKVFSKMRVTNGSTLSIS